MQTAAVFNNHGRLLFYRTISMFQSESFCGIKLGVTSHMTNTIRRN